MSSNHGTNESTFYFDFNHPEHNNVKKDFTNLQSCDQADDCPRKTYDAITKKYNILIIESVESISLDFDHANDKRRRAKARHLALVKENASDSDEESHSPINKTRLASAVNHLKSSNDIRDLIQKDFYQFVFMPIAKQHKNFIRCRVIRNKYDMFHMFRLEIEREHGEEPVCIRISTFFFKNKNPLF